MLLVVAGDQSGFVFESHAFLVVSKDNGTNKREGKVERDESCRSPFSVMANATLPSYLGKVTSQTLFVGE